MTRIRLVALVTAAGLAVPGIALAAAWSVGLASNATGTAAAGSLSAPGAGSTSSPTTTSLTVNWSAPSGTSPTGYQVLREGTLVSFGGCASSTTSASTNVSCVDSGLTAGTTYHYQVKAVRSNWTSPLNAQFTGTTSSAADTTPPMVSISTCAGSSSPQHSISCSGSYGTAVGDDATSVTVYFCTADDSPGDCLAANRSPAETTSSSPGVTVSSGTWSANSATLGANKARYIEVRQVDAVGNVGRAWYTVSGTVTSITTP